MCGHMNSTEDRIEDKIIDNYFSTAVTGSTAVDPAEKVSTTWGNLKAQAIK